MNRFLKESLWLFGLFPLCGMFFSCKGDGYYWPREESLVAPCNIPEFYDNRQGNYKGEIFLIESDSILEATSDTVMVKLGNYANKDLEIDGFPIKYFLQKANDASFLATIPSCLWAKKTNISFKYFLYGYLTFQYWPYYESIDGDSIDSSYTGPLYVGIDDSNKGNFYSDSIYNEDNTQKLKFEVYGEDIYPEEEWGSNAIIIKLCNMVLNDKVCNPNHNIPIAKIKFSKKKIDR